MPVPLFRVPLFRVPLFRVPLSPRPTALALLTAVAAVSAAAPAWADQRPVTIPTRDVDITYQMQAPGPDGKPVTLTQRSRWDTAEHLMRVDPPGEGLYTVMNMPQHKLMVVRDADRKVEILHTGSASVAPGVSRLAQFTRVGPATVAGLACTDWQTTDQAGRPSTVCLTDDGVLLRAKSGDQVLVQAVQVTYGPLNPALFAPPPGYAVSSPPQ